MKNASKKTSFTQGVARLLCAWICLVSLIAQTGLGSFAQIAYASDGNARHVWEQYEGNPDEGGTYCGIATSHKRNEYPDDGREIAYGYWYVYQGSDHVNPTRLATSVTDVEAGESVTLTITEGTNTYGGSVDYTLEQSLDGGETWIEVSSNSTTVRSVVAPDTGIDEIRFRVRATDAYGYESPSWVESNVVYIVPPEGSFGDVTNIPNPGPSDGAFYNPDKVGTEILNSNDVMDDYNWVDDNRVFKIIYAEIQRGLTGAPDLSKITEVDLASAQSITYSVVSGSSIASVNAATGVVTGLAVGEAVIAATIVDAYGTTHEARGKVVIIPRSIDSVSLSYAATVNVDEAVDPTLTISPASYDKFKSISFEITSGISYAKIKEASGVLTGVAPGTVTVKVTIVDALGNTRTATATVTVKAPLTGISLSKTSSTLNVGSSETLTVTYDPSNTTDDKNVTWISSNSAIATVSGGKVTAVAPGTATITAKVGSCTATCTVTVKAPLQGISLNKSSTTINVGSSETLTVTYTPSNTTDDKTVTWTSSNTSVATVSGGKMTAVAPGTATITAAVDGKTATCTVTVKAPLTGISLNETSLNLNIGATGTLTVSYTPSNTTDNKAVTWTSSDSNVATVNSSGVVTAVNAGTATITAKVGSYTATCTVMVARDAVGTIPSQKGTLTYTGSNQTPEWNNYNPDQLTLSVVAQKDAGKYTATFTPKGNYKWSDGTTSAKTVEWEIKKADGSVVLSKTSGFCTYPNTFTFTITKNKSGGDLSVTTSSSSVATATLNGMTVTVNPGTTAGQATITVTSAATSNYNEATAVFTIVVGATAEYKVEHWHQNVHGTASSHDSTNYTLKETEELTGTTASTISPAVKSYTGFTAPAKQSVTISPDGTTVVKYYYTRNSYTVTYNSNNGAGTMTQTTVLYGATYTAPDCTFTRKGYSFSSWNEAANGTGNSWAGWIGRGWTWTHTKNITLYAQWTPKTYTIKYMLGSGSGTPPADQTVTFGEKVTTGAGTLPRRGYSFAGWTTRTDNVNDGYGWTNWTGTWSYDDGQYGIQDGVLVLYPRWIANTYTIVYNANGGSGTMDNQTVTFDTTVTIASNKFTRKGYSFVGWSTRTDNQDDGYGWSGWTGKWTYVDGKYGITDGVLTLYARWVKDEVPLQSISLNKTSTTLNVGGSEALTVTYNPSNTTDSKTVTWTSSNSAVATVSGGKVTAVAPGTATITATVGSKTATCTVTVKAPLQGISLNNTSTTLNVDGSETLTVTYNPSNTTDSKTVTWTSSNIGVATVSGGKVTAVAPGTTTITAKVGSFTATCTVTVNAPLQSISLNKTSMTLDVGGSATLTVTYNPSNTTDDKTVTWTSSNTNVATVSDGKVTAKGAGTATITAAVGSKSATCTVTVNALPSIFAVFSSSDNSLTFYFRTGKPTAGATFNGKAATKVYTGFDTATYTGATSVPWKAVITQIQTVNVADTGIAPVSTAYWFSGATNLKTYNGNNLSWGKNVNASYMFYGAVKLSGVITIPSDAILTESAMTGMFANAATNADCIVLVTSSNMELAAAAVRTRSNPFIPPEAVSEIGGSAQVLMRSYKPEDTGASLQAATTDATTPVALASTRAGNCGIAGCNCGTTCLNVTNNTVSNGNGTHSTVATCTGCGATAVYNTVACSGDPCACGYSASGGGGSTGGGTGGDSTCTHAGMSVSYTPISDTQHNISSWCPSCGLRNNFNTTHTWGSSETITSVDKTQHVTTKSCTVCGYDYETYQNHVNVDDECIICGEELSVTIHYHYDSDENGLRAEVTQSVNSNLKMPYNYVDMGCVPDGYIWAGFYTGLNGTGERVDENTKFVGVEDMCFYAYYVPDNSGVYLKMNSDIIDLSGVETTIFDRGNTTTYVQGTLNYWDLIYDRTVNWTTSSDSVLRIFVPTKGQWMCCGTHVLAKNDGTATLTATITDADGATYSKSVNITVDSIAPATMLPQNTWYKGSVNASTITYIGFKNYLETIPAGYDESWDASVAQDGSIMCYRYGTGLIVVGNGAETIKANADASYMFSGTTTAKRFTSLTAIDGLGILDTGDTTNMSYMFYYCGVAKLELYTFDTSSVTAMDYMFRYCSNLRVLDISSFSTVSVSSMKYAFYNCTALEKVELGAAFARVGSYAVLPTPSTPGATGKWYNESGTAYDASSIPNNTAARYYALKQDGVYALLYDDGSLVFQEGPTPDASKTLVGRYTDFAAVVHTGPGTVPWYGKRTSIISVEFADPISVKSTSYWFYGATKLASIFDIHRLDTSEATSMAYMFYNCSALTELDLSALETPLVTTMAYMFSGCQYLKVLDISSFDTSSLTTMQNMFATTYRLSQITLGTDFAFVGTNGYLLKPSSTYIPCADGNWYDDYGNAYTRDVIPAYKSRTYYAYNPDGNYAVLYSSGVFEFLNYYPDLTGGTALDGTWDDSVTVVDVYSGWDTATYTSYRSVPWYDERTSIKKVMGYPDTKSTAYWFYGAANLTDVSDLMVYTNADGGSAAYMFYNCTSLVDAEDLWLSLDGVTSVAQMFRGCTKLEKLPSYFSCDNATTAEGLFRECTSLKEVQDFPLPNCRSLQNASYMFYGCTGLESARIILDGCCETITNISYILYGCTNLLGCYLSLGWPSTPTLTNMSYVFYNCQYMQNVIIEGDTSKVTSMQNMFYQNRRLAYAYLFIPKYVGTNGYLPTPSSSYITGANSKWYDASGTAYTPAQVATLVNNGGYPEVWATADMAAGASVAAASTMSMMRSMSAGVMMASASGSARGGGNPAIMAEQDTWYNSTIKKTDIVNILFQAESYRGSYVTRWDASEAGDGSVMAYAVKYTVDGKMIGYQLVISSCDYGIIYAAEDASGMFEDFTAVTEITGLEILDTGSTKNMSRMFYGCSSLKELDLSRLRTVGITDSSNMSQFAANCSELETIILGDNFGQELYTVVYHGNGSTSGSMADEIRLRDVTFMLPLNRYSRTDKLTLNYSGNGTADTTVDVPFTFSGWSNSANDDTVIYSNANGGVARDISAIAGGTSHLYAVWTSDGYTLPTPTRTGYTCIGWATTAGATVPEYACGSSYVTDGNETLYAVWKANNYTVVFNANNGIGEMDQQVFTYDKEQALRKNTFTRTGYTFLGWSEDKNATIATYSDGESVMNLTSTYSGTITLYAVWEANAYTVSFNANTGVGTMEPQVFTYDQIQALRTNTFTKEGYTFLGWGTTSDASTATYTDGQSVKNLVSGANGTITLYAVWSANTYTVKFDRNTGTGSMSDQTFKYDTAQALSANSFTKEGYTFIGWATTASATTPTYTNKQRVSNLTSKANGSVTLYAVWQANTYTVKFDGNGKTNNVSIADVVFTYDKAQNLPQNVFEKTGYTFLGWSVDKNATTATYSDQQRVTNLTTSVNGTVTLYAVWKANNYSVVFHGNGGTGTMADQAFVYDNARELTLNGFEREHYVFLGWTTSEARAAAAAASGAVDYTDGQKVSNLTSVQNGKVHLYAVWRVKNAVTINSQPVDVSVKYDQNATFSVSASGPVPVDPAWTLSYQWYYSSNGSEWTPISGATDSTYTVASGSKNVGTYWYKVRVTSTITAYDGVFEADESVYVDSRAAKLTITKASGILNVKDSVSSENIASGGYLIYKLGNTKHLVGTISCNDGATIQVGVNGVFDQSQIELNAPVKATIENGKLYIRPTSEVLDGAVIALRTTNSINYEETEWTVTVYVSKGARFSNETKDPAIETNQNVTVTYTVVDPMTSIDGSYKVESVKAYRIESGGSKTEIPVVKAGNRYGFVAEDNGVFEMRATDTLGNVTSSGEIEIDYIDKIAPEIVGIAGMSYNSTSGMVDVLFLATDNRTTEFDLTYCWDYEEGSASNVWIRGINHQELPFYEEFVLAVRDIAGNITSQEYQVTLTAMDNIGGGGGNGGGGTTNVSVLSRILTDITGITFGRSGYLDDGTVLNYVGAGFEFKFKVTPASSSEMVGGYLELNGSKFPVQWYEDDACTIPVGTIGSDGSSALTDVVAYGKIVLTPADIVRGGTNRNAVGSLYLTRYEDADMNGTLSAEKYSMPCSVDVTGPAIAATYDPTTRKVNVRAQDALSGIDADLVYTISGAGGNAGGVCASGETLTYPTNSDNTAAFTITITAQDRLGNSNSQSFTFSPNAIEQDDVSGVAPDGTETDVNIYSYKTRNFKIWVVNGPQNNTYNATIGR